MLVHPKQLVAGCYITKEVIGKTNRPIVLKNTVVTEQHIVVLNKFLVSAVEVSDKLSNGLPFIPKETDKGVNKHDRSGKQEQTDQNLSFAEHYLQAIRSYKEIFHHWQSGSAVDMNRVRGIIVPLLERIEKDGIGLDLFLLHNYADKKDYFYHHGVAVSLLSAFLAKKRGYKKEWIQIGLAGFLADSGMAKLSVGLFKKESDLNSFENEEVRKHPTYSYRLVEKIPSLSMGVKLAILQHHERLNGSGYPLGVDRNKIHPFAFILAICDSYHAMTCDRVYQTKLSPFKAIEEMMQDRFNKFDHETLQAFVDSLINFTTGSRVLLSNNETAEIVFLESINPTMPMVRLDRTNDIISLKDKQDIYIEEILTT